MISKRRHIKNLAAFFLAFYSLFIVYAALHTHGIHLSIKVSVEEQHKSNITHPFLDSDNNCRLVSFSNSLYTCCQHIFVESSPNFSSTKIQLESQFNPLLTLKESLQLRAPPSAS